MKRTCLICFAFGLVLGVKGCSEPPRQWARGTDRIVVLPDTQCYSRFYPQTFASQGAFISQLSARSTILHAVHVGDITDLNSDAEWMVARDSMGVFMDEVGLTLVTGNHDLGEGGSANTRVTGIDRFFGDLTPDYTFDGSVQNSASFVGEEWLVVGLEFAPRASVLAWANTVVAANPTRFVLIVTHAYRFNDDQRYDREVSPPQPFHPSVYTVGATGADGEDIWNQLGRRHANVRFIVSGHVPGTYAVSPVRGDAGNLVWEIVVDFQDVPCNPQGGDGQGFLLVLERSAVNKVGAVIFSPWLDATMDEQELVLEPLSVAR